MISRFRHQQLQAEIKRKMVWLRQIARLQGAVRYTVNSDLLFPSGSWEMSSDGQRIIARLAQKLAPTHKNGLIVAGYTDNAPIGAALRRGGVTTNLNLSQRRPGSVMQFMISQGVNMSSLPRKGLAKMIESLRTTHRRAALKTVELKLPPPTADADLDQLPT